MVTMQPYRDMGIYRPTLEWSPSAPIVSVSIADNYVPLSMLSCDALLDTGSDGTLFPLWVAESLGLPPIDEEDIKEGPNVRQAFTYLVNVMLPWGEELSDFELIGDPEREYAIIGRDILNLFKLTFDGPNQMVGRTS